MGATVYKSSRLITDLDPELQGLCATHIMHCNTDAAFVVVRAHVILTQTYRNEADQEADYAKGRTAPGKKVTNSHYGQSPHNCVNYAGQPAAKAYDIAIQLKNGSLDWPTGALDILWNRAIQLGDELGLISGSQWPTLRDNPHFELASWRAPRLPFTATGVAQNPKTLPNS